VRPAHSRTAPMHSKTQSFRARSGSSSPPVPTYPSQRRETARSQPSRIRRGRGRRPRRQREPQLPQYLSAGARSAGRHDSRPMLAGPAVTGVADDPEAAAVYEDCLKRWGALPHALRSRVHLACTPMADPDEAAAIVNALQRHAAVVVQKSFAEGFGLTVAEGMWKSRPVVGTAVGGIADQISSGEHGLLVDDPADLEVLRCSGRAFARRPRGS
jgi:glycosyltransferase involved in cell wall biosynthesis